MKLWTRNYRAFDRYVYVAIWREYYLYQILRFRWRKNR